MNIQGIHVVYDQTAPIFGKYIVRMEVADISIEGMLSSPSEIAFRGSASLFAIGIKYWFGKISRKLEKWREQWLSAERRIED